MLAIDAPTIRLSLSGHAVDPRDLPENVIMIIAKTFAELPHDPCALLATYAYIFAGLKISEIKDMFILSDHYGTRIASREYIRQRIVATFQTMQRLYHETYGDGSVSPLFRDKNIDPVEIHTSDYIQRDEEEHDDTEGNEEENVTDEIEK